MPLFPVIHTRAEWSRMFTDPTVWRPLVEHIIAQHSLGPVETMRAGFPGSNAVFIINDTWVVKIIAPFFRADYAREIEMYRLLGSHPDLIIPELIADGTVHGETDWPYMVITCLPGERLGDVWPNIPDDDRLEIINRSARWTRIIHDLSLSNLSALSTDRSHWSAFLQTQIAGCAAHHRPVLSDTLIEQIPDYLAAAPLFPETTPLCLLHGDLTCDHILVSLQHNRWEVTGLIDFGDAETGQVEYDFVAVGLDLLAVDKPMRHTYMTHFLSAYGYQPDTRFSRSMTALTLLHRFSDLRPWINDLGGPEQVKTLEQLETYLWG